MFYENGNGELLCAGYTEITSGISQIEVMGDAASRLLATEHPIMMIEAIIIITVGWSKHKKKTDDHKKFKTFVIFYGIGLLLMLSKIPWNQWPTAYYLIFHLNFTDEHN